MFIRSFVRLFNYIIGMKHWSKIADSKKHTMSQDHQSANIAYNTFMKGKPVNCQLSDETDKQRTQREITIKKNRNIIGRLFDVIRLLIRQIRHAIQGT